MIDYIRPEHDLVHATQKNLLYPIGFFICQYLNKIKIVYNKHVEKDY